MQRSTANGQRTGEEDVYERVLSVYAELGYPRELVSHWAIPRGDVQRLLAEIDEVRPSRILEVGTFVGVATLMMASQCRDDTIVHSIDPNLPLEIELHAMNTPSTRADVEARPQDIAGRAAERLGLRHKIAFHIGGFSTGATFASTKASPIQTVNIVGPEVCKKFGPFDLIFIDGLHYSDAVLGDLRLARSCISPRGRIVLHDVIGCWGSNIRRAVYQFLGEAPEFVFRHGRYADVYDAIGVLEPSSAEARQVNPRTHDKSFLDREEFWENLAAVLYNVCSPNSAVYLGHDRGRLLWNLSKMGVKQLLNVGTDLSAPGQSREDSPNRDAFDFLSVYQPTQKFDLCICLPDAEDLQQSSYQDLTASCVQCSDTILFGSTPPGEAGIASPRALPIECWVREFWKHGYRFYDVIRPHFEALRFANSYSPVYEVQSAELSNLYLVRRDPLDVHHAHEYVGQVLIEKERRIEDLVLQGIFSDVALQRALKQLKAAQDLVGVKEEGLLKSEQMAVELNERVTQQQRTIEERDARIQQHQQAIVERDARLRQYERTMVEREQTMAQLTQSLEYRLACRLVRYPRLLRIVASIWQSFSSR
ncbi:MAG TPA: class I SAM-dependent methyltransferase [Nitrospira sp.]|nr:class I SAM-dependent methyltransferase [Nitrospira sp.]